MSILKNIARRILRQDIEDANLLRDQQTLRMRQEIDRAWRRCNELEEHAQRVEKRYDEQRSLNANLLEASRSFESVNAIFADRRHDSQKVWLHAKIAVDRRLVTMLSSGPTDPAVQTLALSVARRLIFTIKGLSETFRLPAPPEGVRSTQVHPE